MPNHDQYLEALADEQDIGAAAAAQALGIGNALFKNIGVGEWFRFANDNTVQVKLARGYRRHDDAKAPTFTTGQRTAVFRV